MRIFNQPVSTMHLWAVALLSILAAASSYALHVFPLGLISAVIIGGVIEALIRKLYMKHAFKIPFSGFITGLIIGSVAPINAPLLLILVASAIAICSKFFIKIRSSNIFNPAALGLIVALAVFGMGDEWWAAGNYNLYGMAISLTPILIILAYEARRLTTAVSFVLINLILILVLGIAGPLSISSVPSIIFGVNYFFAFVMLVEPKTSPSDRYMQIAYGGSIAIIYTLLAYLRIPYPLLIVLLIGNVAYAIYRKYLRN